MRKTGLQRGVGVALWRQIADGIRREIGTGIADATGRLPSEMELALRFGANRHTVRAAIAALVHEGVLQAEQGRGTYVRQQKRLRYPIGARTRFSAGLEGQARNLDASLVGSVREPASAAVAQALGIATGDAVIRIETLGRADDVPVSRATSWFDAGRFAPIAELHAELGSMTAALRRLGVADYLRASTAIEARHADEADTDDLGLSPGAIVMVTRAINVDTDGRPIQYSESRFPADRVELVIEPPPASQAVGRGQNDPIRP